MGLAATGRGRRLGQYRSCTWSEKRVVLRAFWTRQPPAEPWMGGATLEYGRAAIASLVVILAELAVIATVSMGRHRSWAVAALGAALVVAFSLGWAVKCLERQRWGRAPLEA